MENKRPYWQVGIRLLFSLAATAAFVIIGIKAIGFLKRVESDRRYSFGSIR